MKFVLAPLFAAVLLSACTDIGQTRQRSALLNSSGPEFEISGVRSFEESIQYMRRFYGSMGIIRDGKNLNIALKIDPLPGEYASDDALPPIGMAKIEDKFSAKDLAKIRSGIFTYVDNRCDAYVDAIFWAKRTRGAASSGSQAIQTAVSTILGATGGSAEALSIIAAGFGLSGSLLDAYYDSVLYQLDPSAVQNLINQSRVVFRSSKVLDMEITSEGMLLGQIQDYIRLCTPAHIEFLVNEAVKDAKVKEESKEEKPNKGGGQPAGGTDGTGITNERAKEEAERGEPSQIESIILGIDNS